MIIMSVEMKFKMSPFRYEFELNKRNCKTKSELVKRIFQEFNLKNGDSVKIIVTKK